MGRVEKAEEQLKAEIADITGKVKAIKDEMLRLEAEMGAEGSAKGAGFQARIKAKSNELNALSDYVVGSSKRAWVLYNGLAKECEPSAIEGVRLLCKEIEVIAADLLCYSLGH